MVKNKKGIVKFIAIATILVAMLLATMGLAACELSPTSTSTTGSSTIEEYRLAAITDLESHAAERGESNFSADNWAVIQGHVATGIAAINDAVDKVGVAVARDSAKASINSVPLIEYDDLREWGYSECGRFALSILVNETTRPLGSSFRGSIEFRNISGEDQEVYQFFFWPAIIETQWERWYCYVTDELYWEGYVMVDRVHPEFPFFTVIKSNARFGFNDVVLSLPVHSGMHYLRLSIVLYSNWCFEQGWLLEEKYRITILSNIVLINVQ